MFAYIWWGLLGYGRWWIFFDVRVSVDGLQFCFIGGWLLGFKFFSLGLDYWGFIHGLDHTTHPPSNWISTFLYLCFFINLVYTFGFRVTVVAVEIQIIRGISIRSIFICKHALASIIVFSFQWYFLFGYFIVRSNSLQSSTVFPGPLLYIFATFPILSFRYLF